MSAGTLSRFAFYGEWLRVEHAGRDATIVKPDQHQSIALNLSKRSARIEDTSKIGETYVVDDEDRTPPESVGEPVSERLPDATIAGLPGRGYRTTATVELKRGLGWCASGRHTVMQDEYVTDLPDPQPANATPGNLLESGCAPSGTRSYREPVRLVLYRATTVDAGAKSITLMFERGNVRALDASSIALFTVPPNFTQEP